MSLRDVFVEELRDLYSAENQLVKALPKLVKAVGEEEIVELLNQTLQEEEAARDKLGEKGQALIQSAAQESDAGESEEEEDRAASGRKSPASVRTSQRSSEKAAKSSRR